MFDKLPDYEVVGNKIVKYFNCIIRFKCFIQFIICFVHYVQCAPVQSNRILHIFYTLSFLFHFSLTFTLHAKYERFMLFLALPQITHHELTIFLFIFFVLTLSINIQIRFLKQKCNKYAYTRGKNASHADLIQSFPNLFIIFN